jgi:DNA-binding transcriptional ArsR family regulator
MQDFASEAQTRINQQIEELTEYIQREAAHRKILIEAAAASQDRQRRMERAVASLSGTTTTKKTKPPAQRKYVSPKVRTEIMTALGEHGPCSAAFIAEMVGKSDATIYTVLNQLREDGKARIAGVGEKKSRTATPPRLWATMPQPVAEPEGEPVA